MIEIIPVQTKAEREIFMELAQEYVDWLLLEIEKHYPDLDRASFSAEHQYDDIRKKFSDEDKLFIAKYEDKACGSVALGHLSKNICELRTMYIQPEFRGKGLGKKLAEMSISTAKNLGYSTMRLDTLDFMQAALGLYKSLGFYEIEAYIDLPASLKKYIHFLECDLA